MQPPVVSEATASVAALPPAEAGVKTTFAVQLPPGASVCPLQVFEATEKLLAEAPVMLNPISLSEEPSVLATVFEIVIVCAALAEPTACELKVNAVGLTPITGALNPVPLRLTVCVLKMSEIVSVPLAGPAAVGTNSTLIAQLELAPKFAVQVLEPSSNGPLTE
jgi:hypothetical protein